MPLFRRKNPRRSASLPTLAWVAIESLERRSLLAAAPVVLVTNTNVQVDDQPTPLISWTRPDNAVSFEVLVSLNDVSVVHETRITDTTFAFPPDFQQGDYDVRVRAQLADGEVTIWSVSKTVPLVREIHIEMVGQPATNGTQLRWTEFPNALDYEVWVNESDGEEETLVFREPRVTGNFVILPELQTRNHSVWVRANLRDGAKSEWSAAHTFLVSGTGQPVRITSGLGLVTSAWPTINWDGDDSSYYDIFVNRVGSTKAVWQTRWSNTSNSKIIGDPNPLDPGIVDTIPAGDYEVWIRSSKSQSWSRRGNTLNFRPGGSRSELVNVPPVILPVTTASETRPEIFWSGSSGATYELYVSTNDSIEPVIHEKSITGNSFTPPNEMERGTYRVWVRGYDVDGKLRSWSAVSRFEIYAPPVAFIHGVSEIQQTLTPTIAWTNSDGVDHYEFYIASFGNVVLEATTKDAYYTFETPLSSGTYQVWVRAQFLNGSKSVWGRGTELVIAPGAFAGFQAERPSLVIDGQTVAWTAIDHAVTYELWINEYDAEGKLVGIAVVRLRQLTEQSYQHDLPSGNYRAWLQATDLNGEKTQWSVPLLFD